MEWGDGVMVYRVIHTGRAGGEVAGMVFCFVRNQHRTFEKHKSSIDPIMRFVTNVKTEPHTLPVRASNSVHTT